MRNGWFGVWWARLRSLLGSLRFSALDPETQRCVAGEIFYFNNSRMLVCGWVILLIEAANMSRVLFFSKSRLATANNRQYFAMYALLFLSAVVVLTLRRLLQDNRPLLSRCYLAFAAFWVVWHATLTSMDLRSGTSTLVLATALFGISFLLRLKPWEAVSMMGGGFLLLVLLSPGAKGGVYINTGIATLMAASISCSRYGSMVEEVGYRRKMVRQNDRNVVYKQQLALLREQHRFLLEKAQEPLFEWDLVHKTAVFSPGWQSRFATDPAPLAALLQAAQTQGAHGAAALRADLRGLDGQTLDCQVELALQYDSLEKPLAMLGRVIISTASTTLPQREGQEYESAI